MKEYIEREEVLKHKRKMSGADFGGEFWDEAVLCENIRKIPAADVAPVIHGKWIGMEGDVCSECGASLVEIMDADSYYAIGFDPSQLVACPFCGAKMDGGNQ